MGSPGTCLEFVAYRTELDMSVTRCQFNQAAVQLLNDKLDNITVQCFAFQGYKISAISVEPGGRMYQCGPRGTVVATDLARSDTRRDQASGCRHARV